MMGNTTHMVVYLTDRFCVRVSPRRIQAVEWLDDCFVTCVGHSEERLGRTSDCMN